MWNKKTFFEGLGLKVTVAEVLYFLMQAGVSDDDIDMCAKKIGSSVDISKNDILAIKEALDSVDK